MIFIGTVAVGEASPKIQAGIPLFPKVPAGRKNNGKPHPNVNV
jgi:hypothetical protein